MSMLLPLLNNVFSYILSVLQEKTGIAGENHLHTARPLQNLQHKAISSTSYTRRESINILVVIGAYCIGIWTLTCKGFRALTHLTPLENQEGLFKLRICLNDNYRNHNYD